VALSTVKDRRQATRVSALVIEGATRRSEGIGKRKDVASDQKVRVLGANGMPKYAIRGNRDFRHEIGARNSDAFRGKTTECDPADHAILFADSFTVQEFLEFGRFGVVGNRCR
jgi:hypothetical protein